MAGYDVAIVGAGIVGLATARAMLERLPRTQVAVIDKEATVGAHQTGHNSGVVHAGLYYAPGSLKARLCREGKAELERYAAERAIPIERVGKLVVATSREELPRLDALHRRAADNGVPGLERTGPERIREIEPAAVGLAGLWSPTTAIVDFSLVADSLATDLRAAGADFLLEREVVAISSRREGVVLETHRGDVRARAVVAAAGLWSDRVASMTGDRGAERIVPFRGDYYRLAAPARALVRGLIYPVPDPRFPFLGVHLTRRIDGEVWAGPNAVLAFARDGYRRRDLEVRELAGVLTYPGFLRLAGRFWRTGLAEMWRDVSKGAFLRSVQRFVPALRIDDLLPGPSGVRAQSLERSGTLVDDFRIGGRGRVLHVRNAPSPAATAAVAIGRHVANLAIERFGLA